MAVSQTQPVLPVRRKPSTTYHPTNSIIDSTKKVISPPASTDRIDRSSFSSVKENHDGTAQSFTDSKTSSYLRNEVFNFNLDNEDAILDDNSTGNTTPEMQAMDFGKLEGLEFQAGPLTNPDSLLFTPCDGFRGWKDIPLLGKAVKNVKSKSYSDLVKLRGYRWEVPEEDRVQLDGGPEVQDEAALQAGTSKLECLPSELLENIIGHLSTDIPPNGYTARNIDLMSLLLTSRAMHSATLATLYNQITIPHSRIFAKFLAHVTEHPSLGTIVRRIDFSHFNPTGAGITARERADTKNLIPETLLRCLTLIPNLREFLAQEHVEDDLSADVLKTLLCDLPRLNALDFCACSSSLFRDSFATALSSPELLPRAMSLSRLSFHECTNLPASTFEILLPRLANLTHLDVAHTRITSTALHSIPHTARLTHLNLSKCSNLSGESVVEFLAFHPAAKELVYLNLSMDPKSNEMLPADLLTALLPVLPSTLRSLNLKGSKMSSKHIPLLLPLTKHVEELGLGRHLVLSDIVRLFAPASTPPTAETPKQEWTPHTLRYIDISDLSSTDLDLSTLFNSKCPILQPANYPLEVLELGPDFLKRVLKSQAVLDRVGWCVKEAGRRAWLVRCFPINTASTSGAMGGIGNLGIFGKSAGVGLGGSGGSEVGIWGGVNGKKKDDGYRGWKWGACYWGMRKVPVARAEVGGMYGHYMFKR